MKKHILYIPYIFQKSSCELFLIITNTHISLVFNSVSTLDLVEDKITIRFS